MGQPGSLSAADASHRVMQNLQAKPQVLDRESLVVAVDASLIRGLGKRGDEPVRGDPMTSEYS